MAVGVREGEAFRAAVEAEYLSLLREYVDLYSSARAKIRAELGTLYCSPAIPNPSRC